LFAAVLCLGVLLRWADVARPFDYRLTEPWREADYYQITRNFERGSLNVLYPRIDWRRDTPGFVEMEFPLLPWTAAVLGRAVGPHDWLLRTLTALLQTGCLFVFALLCRRLLTPEGGLFAMAVFALNPVLIHLGSAPQPDSPMLFFTLVAVLLALGWVDSPSPPRLVAAGVSLGAAILAKATAAHLGLLFALLVVGKLGWRALRTPAIYAAAAAALLPPLAWYGWTHQFWLAYGNSLGISNETHLIGADILWPPRFLWGIFHLETSKVFTPAGWLLAAVALRRPWSRVRIPAVWYATVLILYLIAARTSGDGWAWYYHVSSVPPACLLMGEGFTALWGLSRPRAAAHETASRLAAATLAILTVVSLIALWRHDVSEHKRHWASDQFDLYTCVRQFAPLVAPSEEIVITGGRSTDELGHPVAHDRPMAFAWMDRKGFVLASDELSLGALDAAASRGGRYWIAEAGEVSRGELGCGASRRYARLAECSRGFILFDLRQTPSTPPPDCRGME
jgi:4-amino-4-deoxy-L-arabinose transferase-like glycosyltransferase